MSKKVAFLFGGPSVEHEVSLATAKAALPAFSTDFELLPVFITKEGKWEVDTAYRSPTEAWTMAETLLAAKGVPAEIALDAIERLNPEVVFLGLHGEYGEDGTIQTLLEAHGLTFTGSDSEASELAIDKPRVLQLLQEEAVLVPEFLELTSDITEPTSNDFAEFHGFPIVVLPADRGSSVGVSIVHTQEELQAGITEARRNSERVMISKYITGRELSCGLLVIGKNELVPLPPTEITPGEGHAFFDYEAKYLPGGAHETTPADLTDDQTKQVQQLARKVHLLVGADGYSRVDMILAEDDRLYVLEINTLPGLTPTSLIPQEAKAFGLTFTQLLTTICTTIDNSAKDYMTATTELDDEL